MPYNLKQYDAAKPFMRGGDDNVVDENDKNRIRSYDLYENLYLNSAQTLRLVLRGDDSVPLLMPSARKIIEATHRFLGKDFSYLVEDVGDEGTKQNVELWFREWFKREAVKAKFTSNKRWGLVRGDAHFYLYANPNKLSGERISIKEIDPRQVFLIEDEDQIRRIGYHIVDLVPDWREDDPAKKLARRRTFRKVLDDNDNFTGEITTEVTHWTVGNWDDRGSLKEEERIKEQVKDARFDEEESALPEQITELPLYCWANNAPQNSSWGHSQLTGFETLMYGINQSLSDEDATMVFQGLGMYVTNAAAPIDPTTGELTDWNIGPMQIIEVPGVRGEAYFERVTGVSDVSPYQDHMNFINEKGLEESAGIPAISVGKVDVTVAESGIALELHLLPLLAANEEKEEEIIVILDQMFHDIVTMWLPAYESETFDNAEVLKDISVVTVFADPMPKNKTQEIQDTLLLQTSHLILRSMAVAKLRELGWKYPQLGPDGQLLTDDDIAALLVAEAEQDASLGLAALGGGEGQSTDEFGNPITNGQNPSETPPDLTTIPLGVS